MNYELDRIFDKSLGTVDKDTIQTILQNYFPDSTLSSNVEILRSRPAYANGRSAQNICSITVSDIVLFLQWIGVPLTDKLTQTTQSSSNTATNQHVSSSASLYTLFLGVARSLEQQTNYPPKNNNEACVFLSYIISRLPRLWGASSGGMSPTIRNIFGTPNVPRWDIVNIIGMGLSSVALLVRPHRSMENGQHTTPFSNTKQKNEEYVLKITKPANAFHHDDQVNLTSEHASALFTNMIAIENRLADLYPSYFLRTLHFACLSAIYFPSIVFADHYLQSPPPLRASSSASSSSTSIEDDDEASEDVKTSSSSSQYIRFPICFSVMELGPRVTLMMYVQYHTVHRYSDSPQAELRFRKLQETLAHHLTYVLSLLVKENVKHYDLHVNNILVETIPINSNADDSSNMLSSPYLRSLMSADIVQTYVIDFGFARQYANAVEYHTSPPEVYTFLQGEDRHLLHMCGYSYFVLMVEHALHITAPPPPSILSTVQQFFFH